MYSDDKRWMCIHGSASVEGGGLLIETGGNHETLDEEELISTINAITGLKNLGEREGAVLVYPAAREVASCNEDLDRHIVLEGEVCRRVETLLKLMNSSKPLTPVEEFLLNMIDRLAIRGGIGKELFEGCYEDYLASQSNVDRVLEMVKQRDPDRYYNALTEDDSSDVPCMKEQITAQSARPQPVRKNAGSQRAKATASAAEVSA